MQFTAAFYEEFNFGNKLNRAVNFIWLGSTLEMLFMGESRVASFDVVCQGTVFLILGISLLKKSEARANALFRLLHHYFVDIWNSKKFKVDAIFTVIQRFRVGPTCVLEESRAWIIGAPAAAGAKKCSMRRDDIPLFTRGISPKKKLLRPGYLPRSPILTWKIRNTV